MSQSFYLFVFIILLPFSGVGQDLILRTPGDYSKTKPFHFPKAGYEKVASYSFNRNNRDSIKAELQKLKEVILSTSKEEDSVAYHGYLSKFGPMIDLSHHGERSLVLTGEVATSAKKMTELDFSHLDSLNKIFLRRPGEIELNACIPFYRDGLIFFDSENQIMEHIDICFECFFLRISGKEQVYMTFIQWQLLKKFFAESLAHPIEEN